jgi:hypothetical protein
MESLNQSESPMKNQLMIKSIKSLEMRDIPLNPMKSLFFHCQKA